MSVLGAAQLATTAIGLIQGSKKSKFRTPQLPTLKQLSQQASGAQREQLRGGIRNLDQFGSQFLQAQRGAQERALPGFFEQTRAQIGQGEDLISRLIGGDLERRLTTQAVRGAQSARGVALSPASAIQEGLAVQRQQAANEFQAFGLRGQLAGLEASTPFGVQAFNPGISSFAQLTQLGAGLGQAQAGLQGQAQLSNIQQADASRANTGAGLARLAGGFGGASGGGGFQGFLKGIGTQATQQQQRFPSLNFNFGGGQSQVGTTGGSVPGFGEELGSAGNFGAS